MRSMDVKARVLHLQHDLAVMIESNQTEEQIIRTLLRRVNHLKNEYVQYMRYNKGQTVVFNE